MYWYHERHEMVITVYATAYVSSALLVTLGDTSAGCCGLIQSANSPTMSLYGA